MKKALHFGAGKLGRGLIAKIYKLNSCEVTFVDPNPNLVNTLQIKKEYMIHRIGDISKNEVIKNINILNSNDSKKIIKKMLDADIISTSVVPTNLKHLVSVFNDFISLKKLDDKPVNIVCIENGIKITDEFRKMLNPPLHKNIAFVNAIADRLCMLSEDHPIQDVITEEYASLIFEDQNWIGEKLKNIDYVQDIEPSIMQKFWLLNSVHSLMAFLSKEKYKYVREFADDPIIFYKVSKYADWVIEVLHNKYKTKKDELKKYKEFVFERFSHPKVDDTVERVARNFKLKISESDRFISIIKESKKPEIGMAYIKELYKLNENQLFDEEIANYSKEHGIKKAIKKYSGI